MKISLTLQKEIIDFLKSLPNIHDAESQRALVYHAGLDKELSEQIIFGKSSAQFSPFLVSLLLDYGKLHDGRYAIEAVLEATQSFIGQDKITYCNQLIEELYKCLNSSEELLKKDSIPLTSQTSSFQYSKLIIAFSVLIMFVIVIITGIFIIPKQWKKSMALDVKKKSLCQIQKKLTEYGYSVGTIDCKWGLNTEEMLRRYQQDKYTRQPTSEEIKSQDLLKNGSQLSRNFAQDSGRGAIDAYKKAIEEDPLNSQAYNLLGYNLFWKNKINGKKGIQDEFDLAFIYVSLALDIDPTNYWARYNFALCLGELGRIEEGVGNIETAISEAHLRDPSFIKAIIKEANKPNGQLKEFLNNERFQELMKE